MAMRWSTQSGQGNSPPPNCTTKAPARTPQMTRMFRCAPQNPKRLLIRRSKRLEVEVQRARGMVVEQQHGRRERSEEERQDEPAPPGAHGEKRKEDQDKDDGVQRTSSSTAREGLRTFSTARLTRTRSFSLIVQAVQHTLEKGATYTENSPYRR